MEFQSSRFAARVDGGGRPILLEDQDRTRWDRAQIQRGVTALERSAQALQRRAIGWGPYALQAAIAECHATAPAAGDTDWKRIVMLYDGLVLVARSPVVELNRAVAVAMHEGPERGLELIDALDERGELEGYHLLHSARADLLRRLGRDAEAVAAYGRAAELSDNPVERSFLERRRAELSR
jgi:predicted RNA polymerase sigma factor